MTAALASPIGMTSAALGPDCQLDGRREDVRRSALCGIEFVETGASQATLEVHFLGKAPQAVAIANVRIAGGTAVTVLRVLMHRDDDPALDDWMELQLRAPGDWSTYTLWLVDPASGDAPMAGFDPLFASACFSFKTGCPSDLDCCAPADCPPIARPAPDIDYLAKDYESFRRLILDRLATTLPGWQETHVPDIGVMLVELLAYTGDQLSYYQDAVATEAYLATARLRVSLRRHARLVDYTVHEGCNARAWVTITTGADTPLDLSAVAFCTSFPGAPAGQVLTLADVAAAPAGSVEWFEPLRPARTQTMDLRVAHNRIAFYGWGDGACCLAAGSTCATLLDAWADPPPSPSPSPSPGPTAVSPRNTPAEDVTTPTSSAPRPGDAPRPRALHLQAGDVLIFEEVIGPHTGNPADADPAHRQAVRLTRVTPAIDPLYDTANGGRPVLQIEWCPDDALRFPLCLSAVMPAPDCDARDGISVARGNVVLVDSGCSTTQTLAPVPTQTSTVSCATDCVPARRVTAPPPRVTLALAGTGLTHAVPIASACCASDLIAQDARLAQPAVALVGVVDGAAPAAWAAVPDLLESGPDDRAFVVEIDDAGTAHLRFGNGAEGRLPEAGTAFTAQARWGVGREGNVGAEALTRLVALRPGGSAATLTLRNPMAASGGTDPESVDDVRMFAPSAFKSRLERAVTATDYETLADDNARRLAERPAARCGTVLRKLQNSKATLRWNGSWYEVVLALDPLGTEVVDDDLVAEVQGYLAPYRRIGIDLRAGPPDFVPLDLGLSVCVVPSAQRAHMKAQLLKIFGTGLLADGRPALFNPDGLSFGSGVYASRLVAAAQAVAGVMEVQLTRLARYDPGTAPPTDVPDAVPAGGAYLLSAHQIARLDNDPNRPGNGRLTILVRGGR